MKAAKVVVMGVRALVRSGQRAAQACLALVISVCLGLGLPGVTTAAPLAWSDFYVCPIGPGGLVPTKRLLALDGQVVTLQGHMVQAGGQGALRGAFLLSSQPGLGGDEHEAATDDLSVAHALVVLPEALSDRPIPAHLSRLTLTGHLVLGAHPGPDGRISAVRLLLSEEAAQRLWAAPLTSSHEGLK